MYLICYCSGMYRPILACITTQNQFNHMYILSHLNWFLLRSVKIESLIKFVSIFCVSIFVVIPLQRLISLNLKDLNTSTLYWWVVKNLFRARMPASEDRIPRLQLCLQQRTFTCQDRILVEWRAIPNRRLVLKLITIFTYLHHHVNHIYGWSCNLSSVTVASEQVRCNKRLMESAAPLRSCLGDWLRTWVLIKIASTKESITPCFYKLIKSL